MVRFSYSWGMLGRVFKSCNSSLGCLNLGTVQAKAILSQGLETPQAYLFANRQLWEQSFVAM